MHIAEKELLIDISASKTATQVRRNEFNRVLDYDREEIGLVSTCIWCNDVIKTTSESVLRIIISRISNQISGTNLLLTRILNKSWLMGQFLLQSTWNCVNLWNLKSREATCQSSYTPRLRYWGPQNLGLLRAIYPERTRSIRQKQIIVPTITFCGSVFNVQEINLISLSTFNYFHKWFIVFEDKRINLIKKLKHLNSEIFRLDLA